MLERYRSVYTWIECVKAWDQDSYPDEVSMINPYYEMPEYEYESETALHRDLGISQETYNEDDYTHEVWEKGNHYLGDRCI